MKGRTIVGILLTLILGLMLIVSGCGSEKQAPIVVGGIFSISGPASYLGEPERNTLQMMVADINAKGGKRPAR